MILAAPCPSFEELSSVERGRRLGRLARHALDQYGITPRSIRMVREGFCTTFRVMDHDRQVYALKAGRMGTETVESLRFEAELVAHIRAHGLPVPQVVLSSDGTPVVVATDCIAGYSTVYPLHLAAGTPRTRQNEHACRQRARPPPWTHA
jgi:hypothetical protein